MLTGLTRTQLDTITAALASPPGPGRPWALPLPARIVLTAAALRTNLTVRQIAAVFDIPKSQAHRIITDLTPKLAGLLPSTIDGDRRWSWTVDGTLIPTRDRTVAGKSKNYRYSTNAQVLSRRRDLLVIDITGGGAGNRNDTIPYRDSTVQQRCAEHGRVYADGGYRGITELHTPTFAGGRIVRDAAWRRHRKKRARAEHCIARLKDWQVLRDHRRRGHRLPDTLRAVADLHNLRILTRTPLRDVT
ncbi:Putative transposase for insertion sequence element IS112 (plasmid) [Euzebya pacifica]|uniref:Transposase for insertion sequence element IS112 n=1 Tax=Euzebya pacifica TaxID=1608957 RepID=A0A346Y758_9ACTN|nr:Putative transposase for insertion sequence element IS112 [Euzebya pacifica]